MYTNKQVEILLKKENPEAQQISSLINSADETYKSSSTRRLGYVDFPHTNTRIVFYSHPQSPDSTIFEIHIQQQIIRSDQIFLDSRTAVLATVGICEYLDEIEITSTEQLSQIKEDAFLAFVRYSRSATIDEKVSVFETLVWPRVLAWYRIKYFSTSENPKENQRRSVEIPDDYGLMKLCTLASKWIYDNPAEFNKLPQEVQVKVEELQGRSRPQRINNRIRNPTSQMELINFLEILNKYSGLFYLVGSTCSVVTPDDVNQSYRYLQLSRSNPEFLLKYSTGDLSRRTADFIISLSGSPFMPAITDIALQMGEKPYTVRSVIYNVITKIDSAKES